MAKHDIADLFDLIWFRLGGFGLNIDYFFEVRHGENMVIAPDALLEAQAPEEAAEPLEGHIRVPFPGENVLKKLLVTVHIAYLALFIDFFGTIAALTREHDGWEQAEGLITADACSRVQCLLPARDARRDRALDEVSAAIPRDAVARNK